MRRLWVFLVVCIWGCSAPVSDLRIATGDSGSGLEPHRRIIALFQERNPGIKIQLEAVSGGDYYTRLLTQLASGQPPDVVHLGDDAMGGFVRRGCLQPLRPVDADLYLPGVLAPGLGGAARSRYAPGLRPPVEPPAYLLPKDFTPLAVYCNRRLFREAGVEMPAEDWTWEDFVAVAAKFRAKQRWGAVVPGPRSGLLEYLVALEGGNWVEFEGPAQERAVQRLQAMLLAEGCPYPTELGSFTGSNQEFERGQAAMKLSGRWPLPQLRKRQDMDLIILPTPRGSRRANILYWSGLGVTAQSPRKQLAQEYVALATGVEGSQIWSGWGLPAIRSVASSFGQDRLERVFLEELNWTVPRTYQLDPTWSEFGQAALIRLHESILLDPGASPQQLLAQQSQRLKRERRARQR